MYTVPTIVRAIARYFDNLYYLCLDLFSELVYDTVFNRKGIHIVPRRSFGQTIAACYILRDQKFGHDIAHSLHGCTKTGNLSPNSVIS